MQDGSGSSEVYEVLVLRVRLTREVAKQVRELATRRERSLNWTGAKLLTVGLETVLQEDAVPA